MRKQSKSNATCFLRTINVSQSRIHLGCILYFGIIFSLFSDSIDKTIRIQFGYIQLETQQYFKQRNVTFLTNEKNLKQWVYNWYGGSIVSKAQESFSVILSAWVS